MSDLAISNFVGRPLDRLPSLDAVGAHRVPLVAATAEHLRGLGHLVDRFDPTLVQIVPWPTAGWRQLVPGTGIEGGITSDVFVMERRGELAFATNHAVGRRYLTGWYSDPAIASADREPTDLGRLYTHEANYHPDGGQIFYPRDPAPFIALLAPPGDDVTPGDFVAVRCPGDRGLHIDPGVWHQPVFPTLRHATFDDAQGRVHACVSVDFLGEFGTYLEVPLTSPRAR